MLCSQCYLEISSLGLVFYNVFQSSELTDLEAWRKPLHAIVAYTFDLSLIARGDLQDQNFYFLLNRVWFG